VIGYFGKIPSHGDFVGRGLPPHLVAAWDEWLQECIHASQEQLGDQWLTHYLTSPVWRFAISPGVLGPEGLGGVMMPSVDRVGRYFPLMLAATGAPPLLDWLRKHVAWYEAVEVLARESLEERFRLDRFEAAPEPELTPIASSLPAGAVWRIPVDEDAGERAFAAVLQGQSLWWTEGGPDAESRFLMCAGMPRQETFAAMLD
jgi:type VI secretion system protein ImpM